LLDLELYDDALTDTVGVCEKLPDPEALTVALPDLDPEGELDPLRVVFDDLELSGDDVELREGLGQADAVEDTERECVPLALEVPEALIDPERDAEAQVVADRVQLVVAESVEEVL
jgi:hypothetical protein